MRSGRVHCKILFKPQAKEKKSFLRVRVVSCWVECRSLALGWVGLIAGLANTLVQLFWPVIS